jgi:hypothetical protein
MREIITIHGAPYVVVERDDKRGTLGLERLKGDFSDVRRVLG